MHNALKFVGPGCIAEQARERGLHFSAGIGKGTSRLLHNTPRKLVLTNREVFRDIVEDLSTVMRCSTGPATCSMGRLNCITNIFAVAFTNLSNDATGRTVDKAGITRIGTNLFAANEHFWRPVNLRHVFSITIDGGGGVLLISSF